jgi:hypothetical protein
MILGYVISVPDIKTTMFANVKLAECARFSNIYDLNLFDVNFRMRNKTYGISSTYDGFVIVSEKFKRFCETESYLGLEFINLPNAPGFYWFKTNNILEFDSNERETRFIDYNDDCKGYEEIIGATPACLKSKFPIGNNFFRTDICFGSSAGKSPLYLTGEVTKKKLEEVGFKEIYFEEVLDNYK